MAKAHSGDNELIIKRIQSFIEHLGLSVNAFEIASGLSTGVIKFAIRNNGTIGVDKLVAISTKYPELNLNWLATGSGSMIITDQTISGNAQINQGTIHAEAVHVTQHNGESLDRCRAEVEALKKENQMLERLLESKEELIRVMKSKRD